MQALPRLILKKLHLYYPLLLGYYETRFKLRNFRNRWRYKQWKGGPLECNVCRAHYQRFMPDQPLVEDESAIRTNHVVAGYSENCICPNCGSTARERLIIACLPDLIDLTDKAILHFAPERYVLPLFTKRSRVVAADLQPELYRNRLRQIQYQNLMQLTFPDQSFDLVVANHILEHIPDDRKAMQEIFRVLKPGGHAVLQVPYSDTLTTTIEEPTINDRARQSALFGQYDHVRIYAWKDYLHRLQETGFTPLVWEGDDLKKYEAYALQPGERMLLLQKPR
ncbi:MAG TPA: methyltransferase domain-containing protein [Ferruginibacter sp.]|nr:methyltransferase domain-containing protein [Ferruginibacter sp.]